MAKDSKEEFQERTYELQDQYRNKDSNYIPSKYGLCSTCIYLNYISSEFKEAACCNYDKPMINWPNAFQPILKCSQHHKKGQLSLDDMSNMATYIEAKDKIVGFKK